MHTTDTRHRFLELRAQGWSLARIATELHLSKTTLVDWNRTARQEIRELEEVEVEACTNACWSRTSWSCSGSPPSSTASKPSSPNGNSIASPPNRSLSWPPWCVAQLRRLTSAPLLTTLDVEASPAATSTPAPTEAQL